VAGLALVLGTGIPPLSSSLAARLPALAVTLLSQPVVVGAMVALVLEVGLVQVPAAVASSWPAGGRRRAP
jgi:xanthine/uracil permease